MSLKKLFAQANTIISKLKTDLPTLVTKGEKIELINEAEKLLGHNGVADLVDAALEKLRADVNAEPDPATT